MDSTMVIEILHLIQTMEEMCFHFCDSAEKNNFKDFAQNYQDMREGLSALIRIANSIQDKSDGVKKLSNGCKSSLASLVEIYSCYGKRREYCIKKIEFELLPLLQEVYLQFYIYQYLAKHETEFEEYEKTKRSILCGNFYIDEAIQQKCYKYDISIVVLAYNKLEYTRQCVESLLNNLPKSLRYELIFVNHGSSDGTKEYFSGKSPDKQLDISVNGGGVGAFCRIVEGEFTLMISNDVIVGPHAIENLYACISSDPTIAWVVSTTPNISNLQSIPTNYNTMHEFHEFAAQNNRSDSFRWEQRVRLCNPIDIRRNSVFYSSSGLCMNGRFHSFGANSFPDDRTSLLLRRKGYKMMLAKDAYCHHFGSVTLKSEVQKHGELDYYLNGRKEFYRAYGVDPWGTGCCFAVPFMRRVVGNETAHVDILGINCGMGANSLKIKEQLKEYCHNLDVTLYNITDRAQFVSDLNGVSDQTNMVCDLKQLKKYLGQRKYQYIVWEDEFLSATSSKELIALLKSALSSGGSLFFKQNSQNVQFMDCFVGSNPLGSDWFAYQQKGF